MNTTNKNWDNSYEEQLELARKYIQNIMLERWGFQVSQKKVNSLKEEENNQEELYK